MELPKFKPALPRIELTPAGTWQVTWDRSAESTFISSLVMQNDLQTNLIHVRNIDDVSSRSLKISIRDKVGDIDIVDFNNVNVMMDFWQVVLTGYYSKFKLLPTSLTLSFAKHMRYGFHSNRTIDGILRKIAEGSTVAFTADTQALVLPLLEVAGVNLADMSGLVQHKILDSKHDGDAAMRVAVVEDYNKDDNFRSYFQGTLFLLEGAFLGLDATVGTADVPNPRCVMMERSRLGRPYSRISQSGYPELGVGVATVEQATNILRPIWRDNTAGPNTKTFVSLILQERAKARSGPALDELVLGEEEFTKTLETVRLAVTTSTEIASIGPRTSPLQAEVVGETLTLENTETPNTTTPLDALEDMRTVYLADSERILDRLENSNVDSGFVARVSYASRTLSKPFTSNSSLILGDQVRALEVMLPSIAEILTDVSVADVSAFVAGMGLLVRQFPAWREFMLEAEQEQPLRQDDVSALIEASGVIEQASDKVVEAPLKDAVVAMRLARTDLHDAILDFALVRGIGNIFRAIGRYLLARIKGTSAEFNKSIDKELGQALAKSSVAALFTQANAALLQLAVGVPLEFGWIIGLGILVASKI